MNRSEFAVWFANWRIRPWQLKVLKEVAAMTQLEAIRERNENAIDAGRHREFHADNDRAFLLRLAEYAQHTGYCGIVQATVGTAATISTQCTCGLAALIEQEE